MMENYYKGIDVIAIKINNLIVECMKNNEYDAEDLENIILALLQRFNYTTRDTIQSLIYSLERLEEYY